MQACSEYSGDSGEVKILAGSTSNDCCDARGKKAKRTQRHCFAAIPGKLRKEKKVWKKSLENMLEHHDINTHLEHGTMFEL